MSAPLSQVRSSLQDTATAVERSHRRQTEAVSTATAQIDRQISRQRSIFGGLPGVFGKVGDGASRMFTAAKSSISGDLNKIVSESKSAGERAGSGFATGMKRLVGGAIAGLSLYAVAGVAKEASDAMQNIERINAQTASVIASTGGAAGVTAEHVEALAGEMENLTASEAESVQTGANFLLTFKEIKNGVGEGNDVFDQTTRAMVDMARATGGDMQSAALQLGKALNDPIKGVTALSKVGVGFTDQQKEQIKVLQESGDLMGAQKIILAELNSQFGGSGAAYAETTAGKVELLVHAWGTFTEAAVAKFLPALGKFSDVGADFFNWLAEAPILDWFAGLVIGAGDALIEVSGGLRAFSAAFNAADGDVTSSGFPGLMERLANALNEVRAGFTLTAEDAAALGPELGGLVKVGVDLRNFFDSMAATVGPLGPQLLELLFAFSPLLIILTALLPVLPSLVESLTTLATVAASVLTSALTTLTPVIEGVLTFLADLLGQITDAPGGAEALAAVILTLTGAFVAYKVAVSTTKTVMTAYKAVTGAVKAAKLGYTAATYGLTAASYAEGKAGKAGAAVYLVKAAALKVATGATKLFNLALKANPIGLIITAVTALVAGLVWFFTQTETGQAIVQAAWQGIQGAISAVVDWWNSTLLPAIQAVGQFFSDVWNNIVEWVSGAVSKVREILAAVGEWFASTFGPTISAIGDVFSAVFSWISTYVENAVLIVMAVLKILGDWLATTFGPAISWIGDLFVTIWGYIVTAVQTYIAIIQAIIGALVLFWQTYLQPALQAVGDFFVMVWNGIVFAVQWVVMMVQAYIGLLVAFWQSVLLPALQWVGSLFASIWNGIVAVVQWVVGLVQGAIQGLVDFWNGVLSPAISTVAGFFSGLLSDAIGGVTGFIDKIVDGFKSFVAYIKDKVQPIIDTISGAFSKLGDVVGGALSGIKDFASNPLGGAGDWAKGVLGIENSGGGVYSGGGVVGFAGGGVLGGYAPGRDTIPAILSKGEAVLVPELVRAIGPQNIMAANAAASGGRPAGSGPTLLSGHSGGGMLHASGGAALPPVRPLAPVGASVSTSTSSYGDTRVVIEKVEVNVDNSGGAMTPEEIEEAVESGIEKAFTKARKRDY